MSIEVNNLSQGTDANHQISDKDSIEIDIPKPKKDKKIMDDADPDHIYWRLPLRLWWYIILGLHLTILALMLGTLGSIRWVRQGERGTEWKGGVLRCGGCSGEWNKKSYDEIASQACDNDMKGLCDTFKALSSAGIAYVLLDVFAIFFIIIWSIRIFLCLMGVRKYKDRVTYIVVTVAVILHLLAVILWFSLSGAGLSNDCSKSSTIYDRENICITDGPSLSIVIMFLIAITAFLFSYIFKNRFRAKKLEKNYG